MGCRCGAAASNEGRSRSVTEQKGDSRDRPESFQLDAVVIHVPPQGPHIGRRKLGDLAIHLLDVGRAVELAASTKRQAILRVQPHHRDVLHQVAIDRLEDLRQDAWVEKKGGSAIESKPVQLDRRSSTTHVITTFQNGHVATSLG